MKFKKPKLNSKGFSHIEMIVALVVVIAIAGVGFFVYKHHQDNKSMNSMGSTITKSVKGSSISVNGRSLGSIVPKASAQNLSHLYGAPNQPWNIYACITSFPNNIINIQAYYWKDPSTPAAAILLDYKQTIKNGVIYYKTTRQAPKSSSTYLYGLVTEITMNVSGS